MVFQGGERTQYRISFFTCFYAELSLGGAASRQRRGICESFGDDSSANIFIYARRRYIASRELCLSVKPSKSQRHPSRVWRLYNRRHRGTDLLSFLRKEILIFFFVFNN